MKRLAGVKLPRESRGQSIRNQRDGRAACRLLTPGAECLFAATILMGIIQIIVSLLRLDLVI